MTTNITNKFKDRDPLDTIGILRNFFNSYNYELRFTEIANTVGTFSSHVTLLYNGNLILRANGKGTSKEFAMASALAELYERFCNGLWIPYSQLYKLSLREPDKTDLYQKLSINDAKAQDLISDTLCYNSNNFIKYVLSKYSFNGKIKLNKYVNIQDNDDIKYLSHLHISMWRGTTGMAAGNTLEEALVQCISEIFERLAVSKIIYQPDQKFHLANLDNCSSYLKTIISNINTKGKLYIIDLSYNTNLPVMMALFFDKTTGSTHYNFSSAPIRDIAIERLLTELYQGVNNDDGFFPNSVFQVPSSQVPKSLIKQEMFTHCSTRAFPEQLVLNIVDEDTEPTNIFLNPGEYSNLELLSYLKQLAQNNNLELYYTDVSLIDEMSAVHIFCKQFYDEELGSSMDESEVGIYDYIEKLYAVYEDICRNKEINYTLLANLFMCITLNINRILYSSRCLAPFPDTHPAVYAFYDSNLVPEKFFNSEFDRLNRINSCFDRCISKAKTWFEIYSYLLFTNTSVSDIMNYYKNYIPSLTEEDIKKVTSKEFLILKVIFEPFLESVIDTSLDGIVQPFLDKEARDGSFSR